MHNSPSLEPRLSIPHFVSQLWRNIESKQNPEKRAWVQGYNSAFPSLLLWKWVWLVRLKVDQSRHFFFACTVLKSMHSVTKWHRTTMVINFHN